MLIHLVCWKYKAGTDQALRDTHISRLAALSELVPGIIDFAVGPDVLGLDRSFDTGLYARFTGRESLDAYTVHPDHQVVAAMGRDIAEKVISVDFLTGE